MSRHLSTLAIALAGALLGTQAMAEKVVIYREGQLVQPQDVAKVLTRGISLLDDAPAPPPAARAEATTVPSGSITKTAATPAPDRVARAQDRAEASSLSLPVRFAFDSAEIQPDARPQLDALAQGIKLLPPGSTVIVEGHTDAAGDDAYNAGLSLARASAVRDYLVQHHGIAAARLKTVGFGESRPVEGTDPYAAVNRRVQFRGA